MENKITAKDLDDALRGFLAHSSRDRFERFRRLLFPGSRVIAVAWTFVAFCDPERFPMVDTRTAKWVLGNADMLRSVTLPKYGTNKATVLTMSDYPFVEWWVNWCRSRAYELGEQAEHHWRARDVEMSVFASEGSKLELIR